MTFEDWMLTKDCNYYPTDDTQVIRKLRECWDAAQRYGEVARQLAERDAQLLKNADILGEAADALDHNDKQIVELREAILSVCCNPEGVVCIRGSDGDRKVLQEALAATKDLSNCILCEGEPVAWMFIDDEEYGYHQFNRTPPTKEQVEYLAQHNRPAWNPIYKARKQP